MTPTFLYSLEGQETERLVFRRVEQSDFDTWFRFCSYPDSLKYIFSQQQLAVNDPHEFCNMWFAKLNHRYQHNLGGMNALIEKQTGALVGQCGLLVQSVDGLEELEVGYSLMPEFRGKGYATEAARKCKEFAFEHNFRDSLISTIHIENEASVKVAKANGMVLDKRTISDGDPVFIYRIQQKDYQQL